MGSQKKVQVVGRGGLTPPPPLHLEGGGPDPPPPLPYPLVGSKAKIREKRVKKYFRRFAPESEVKSHLGGLEGVPHTFKPSPGRLWSRTKYGASKKFKIFLKDVSKRTKMTQNCPKKGKKFLRRFAPKRGPKSAGGRGGPDPPPPPSIWRGGSRPPPPLGPSHKALCRTPPILPSLHRIGTKLSFDGFASKLGEWVDALK